MITRGRKENAEATFKQVLRTLRLAGMQPQKSTTHTFGSVWVVRVQFDAD
jgi:hypothetical protein